MEKLYAKSLKYEHLEQFTRDESIGDQYRKFDQMISGLYGEYKMGGVHE